MITTRLATADDAALIADISRQTFYDTFARDNTAEDMQQFMDEEFAADKLISEAQQPENIFLLTFSGEQPAGYCFLRDRKQLPELNGLPAMEIARIYVVKEFIGKGVGKELMQQCIAEAIRQQRKVLWLGVWEHNRHAIEFYRKWGFEKFSSHEFVLGKDVQTDWLMKKVL